MRERERERERENKILRERIEERGRGSMPRRMHTISITGNSKFFLYHVPSRSTLLNSSVVRQREVLTYLN